MARREPGEWDPADDLDPEDREEDLRAEEFPDGRWVEEGHGPYSDMGTEGVDECPACGAEMLSDAARCARCGNYVVAGRGARPIPTWMVIAMGLALVAALGYAGLLWLL